MNYHEKRPSYSDSLLNYHVCVSGQGFRSQCDLNLLKKPLVCDFTNAVDLGHVCMGRGLATCARACRVKIGQNRANIGRAYLGVSFCIFLQYVL